MTDPLTAGTPATVTPTTGTPTTGTRPVFELLPAIHRIRDAERGGPLEKLLSVVEEEWLRLVEDVDGLYDNWFVETCDEWVVPYVADLLGVQGLTSVGGGVAGRRALVANTIAYRRRKGTPAVLEQLARDATGWPARVVEYFGLLATTQHLDHVRPGNVRTPDLRGTAALELVDTPFDRAAHTAEVRHIDVGRGRYDIPYVGLHLWRLGAYAVAGVDARPVDRARERWTVDPAGRDVPLFTRPRTEAGPTHLAEEVDVPARLRRRTLHDELTALRAGAAPVLLAEPAPALRVRLDGAAVDPVRLRSCDLTDWGRQPEDGTVAVDPVLGRLRLPAGTAPHRVLVDHAYGFPGDLGAGPYDRRATLAEALALAGPSGSDRAAWQIGVGRDLDPVSGRTVRTIGDAVRLWNARTAVPGGQVGVIAVTDSATYTGDLDIEVAPGDRLLLVAATRPDRRPRDVVAAGLRPHLRGTVAITATGAGPGQAGAVVIDGFSVDGAVTVRPGDLGGLVVANCTVLDCSAGAGGLVSAAGNPALTVRLLRSVCTTVRLAGGAGLGLADSIVHAGDDREAPAVDAADAHVEIEACTVLGRTTARSLAASDTILRGLVTVERRQRGCVRFSFLPWASRAPRRYRCAPADDASAATLEPTFTSVDPADPAFGQLAADCPRAITEGADDEGEMGAFGFLGQHRRVVNLTSQLDTYLRFGLEAGLIFVT